MDEQEEHDLKMSSRASSLAKSKQGLESLLKEKNASMLVQPQSEVLDPVEAVIKNNPGLTREKVAELAEKFGF